MSASGERRIVTVEEAVLAKNEALAAGLRARFAQSGLLVLNLVSSPGAGKTALLERTLSDLRERARLGVIVGDMATDNDAARLRGKGAPVVQVVTGSYCHLEAAMVARALEEMEPEALDVLIIENVGNLVCPAGYDLGEALRVALLSVTEGEDKPLKYPVMFKSAHLVLVTKIDLAEAVGFDREACLDNIRRVAPQAEILELSSRSGVGLAEWYTRLATSLVPSVPKLTS